MKAILFIFGLFCTILVLDCHKTEEKLEPGRIFFPGDTTNGVAQGLKNNLRWTARADAIYYDTINNLFAIGFTTETTQGFLREAFGFEKIRFENSKYSFLPNNDKYFTSTDDGSLEDTYIVDDSAGDNKLVITKADKTNLYVEGYFTLTYISDPKDETWHSWNPRKVKFADVNFKAKVIKKK